MSTKKALLLSAGIGILGFVIYRYVKIQLALLKDFSFKVIGFHLQSFNKNQVAFTLKFRFYNKSSIEATVSNVYVDAYLDGKKVGYIVNSKQFIIPADGSSDIDLFFSFVPDNFAANAVDIILGITKNKDINLSLRGTASVSSSFVSTSIPISYDTGLKQYL